MLQLHCNCIQKSHVEKQATTSGHIEEKLFSKFQTCSSSVEHISAIICIPSIFYSDTEDFVPAALEGTFVPAMADEAVCFNVTIMDDTMVESTESFLVNFMSSDSAYLSSGLATISILDNEGDTPCYMLEKI